MISEQSLAEELLPNMYVKNVTLDSNYKVTKQDKNKKVGYYDPEFALVDALVPDGTVNSNLILSAKFVKNEGLQSDLALLLDSELNQDFKIFVHQFTDKAVYDSFFTPGDPGSIIDSDGNVTGLGRTLLSQDNTGVAGNAIITKIKTFSEAILDNNAALYGSVDDQSQRIVLPEELLSDGTILNEIIFNLNFNVPKDTDFLSYVICAGVNIPNADATIGPEEITEFMYISNPKKEIVILNGLVQDRGLLFRIAPFSASEQNISQLLKFGNPGDVWAGPVHEHMGVFMAGATHTVEPHPVLDYSIVPISKFVDNRTKEEIEKSILNTTQAFESLNSLTSRYQNQANFLNFKEYKSKSYISEFYLSQDKNRNINGMFFVDKLKIIKYNSQFSAMFEIANKILPIQEYFGFVSSVLSRAELFAIRIYQGDEFLGLLSEGQTEFEDVNSQTKNSFKMNKIDNLYLPQAQNFSLEVVSFKHTIKSSMASHYNYRVEVDYKDPTVDIVNSFYEQFNESTTRLAELINYIDGQNGFDSVTQRIKASVLQNLKINYNLDESDTGLSLTDLFPLGLETALSVLFYVPTIKRGDFFKYLNKFTNLSTVTQAGLLVLQDFMINTTNKLANSLSNVGSKPSKDPGDVFSDYGFQEGQNPGEVKTKAKKISISSKLNTVRTYDYGYDFTGHLDEDGPNGESMRIKDTYLEIKRADFSNLCQFLFFNIATTPQPGEDITSLLDIPFQPGSLPSQTARDTLYSYLNIPTQSSKIKQSVILPPTILTTELALNDIDSSLLFDSKNILTGIVKLNNFIIENNTFSNFPLLNAENSLKEDLISILANMGTSVPSAKQTSEAPDAKVLEGIKATQQKANFVQKDKNLFASTDAFSFQDDPGLSVENTNLKLNPDLGVLGNKFKINDLTTNQATSKGNLDTTKNNLLNSLLARQLLTNAGKNKRFKLLPPIPSFFFDQGPDTQGPLPIQIAALSAARSVEGQLPNALGQVQNPFLDFSKNQNYISNYVINPNLLSEYWFKHQNIVKVEYLSGFESYTEVDYLQNKENPHLEGESVTTVERNVSKPVWKLLTGEILTPGFAGPGILCRLTRYSDKKFVNSHLVNELDMPLINSYFIITN